MNIYFLSESKENTFLGGEKARKDIDQIFHDLKYQAIYIDNCRISRTKKEFIINYMKQFSNWHKIQKKIKPNSLLFIQYPNADYKLNIKNIKKLKNKQNVKVVALIHDLPSIQDQSVKQEIENELLKQFDYLICHNEKMKKVLMKKVGIEEYKLVCLEVFDYLSDKEIKRRTDKNEGITVAGNLSRNKTGYIYKLLENGTVKLNLYGPNFDVKDYDGYRGVMSPEKLIEEIYGSYGLIWDGDSLEKCTGTFGEYQKINNPHRVSMNLAAKMPLIIWNEAALSDFVRENKVGLIVNSLNDIENIISNVTDEEYNEMLENLEIISSRVTSGFYTRKAVKAVIDKIK